MRQKTTQTPLYACLAAILITAGVNYWLFKTDSQDTCKRISQLEALNLQQVKFDVSSHTAAISKLTDDQKATGQAIAALQAKIDVMATKVDFIAERIKAIAPKEGPQ